MLKAALSGGYVNFGVLRLYGDSALDNAIGIFVKLLESMEQRDIMVSVNMFFKVVDNTNVYFTVLGIPFNLTCEPLFLGKAIETNLKTALFLEFTPSPSPPTKFVFRIFGLPKDTIIIAKTKTNKKQFVSRIVRPSPISIRL